MAVSDESVPPVRISKIADRYLVFDAEDVAVIRRNHNICSVLVGTTPQNPTQNVFLSLPLELLPEEASLLVEKKVGRLIDETSHHLSSLRSTDKSTRQAYVALLKDRRHKAQRLLSEDQARKAATEKTRRINGAKAALCVLGPATDREAPLVGMSSWDHPSNAHDGSDARWLTVTPTTSGGLDISLAQSPFMVSHPPTEPLHRHLQARGYFMTPGLRFGADYSVYPGDPLRYHAHFLATNYHWEEQIPMLDVVGSGRLGTSVKKGFLFGGEAAAPEDSSSKQVRTFCVEWAGM